MFVYYLVSPQVHRQGYKKLTKNELKLKLKHFWNNNYEKVITLKWLSVRKYAKYLKWIMPFTFSLKTC